MNDQQTLALKPIYIPSTSQGLVPTKSSAALHGATSAFVPRTTPVVSSSTTSAGARFAAFAAGTSARQRAPRVSPQRQDDGKEKSPTRGRHLTTNNDAALGAARSTSSSNATRNPTRPLLQARSSSTLAARYVSVYSPSPQRSPNRSPSRNGRLPVPNGELERQARSAHALSGAMASMASALVRDRQHDHTATQVRNPSPDPKRVPHLISIEPLRDTNGVPSTEYTPKIHYARNTNDQQNVPSMPQAKANRTPSTQRSAQPDLIPAKVPKQPSAGSVARTAASAVAKAEETRGRPGSKRPPTSARRPSSAYLQSLTQGSAQHVDDHRSALTVSALADAMVASSLASSRAVSPQKSPPPVSRRRSHSVAALYEIKSKTETQRQRNPQQPPRPMKLTLRKQSSSGDEGVDLAKRGRKHWMRKHPNKHSEGDRKRWRDKVTELERKRYEGVFAANRGLLIGSGYFEPSVAALSDNTAVGNKVVNVVVRDIWERSRLPREVLMEIYALVSPEEAHQLSREQFVVGMWLVDQRLKGRKLPVKVSASVWASVRHSVGIKIRNHHS